MRLEKDTKNLRSYKRDIDVEVEQLDGVSKQFRETETKKRQKAKTEKALLREDKVKHLKESESIAKTYGKQIQNKDS